MRDVLPDDDDWLRRLVESSAVLADAQVRKHWRALIPWLRSSDRYALAAILLEIEQSCAT